MTRATGTSRPIRQGGNALASSARPASEALLWSAMVALSAVLATRTGTLPGRSFPILGAAIQGILWLGVYAGLALMYVRAARSSGTSARRVLRRVGLGGVLALSFTHLCRLLLAPLLVPAVWSQFFYLRWLLPLALTGLWCAALLPGETQTVRRAAKARPALAPVLDLAILLGSAAVLVSCTDLAFQWGGGSAVGARLQVDVIQMNAWITNILLLFCAYALAFAITSKAITSLLLISPLYAVLALATLVKIRYMHSAVQPLDLIRVPEFLPLFRSFFGTGALVGAIAACGAWIGVLVAARKVEPRPTAAPHRWAIGMLSLAVLLAFPVAFTEAEALHPVNRLLLLLGAPDGQHREKARANGLLLSFISEMPAALISAPPHYSSRMVTATLRRYWTPHAPDPVIGRRGRVNLIVYMVESFMDPDDLRWHYTADPI
ncbi:MAG TPA: hypothetical protein VFS33_11100, partial [Gemmatimonadales bacterium]|nr:hypothetical protein [Gemmatimonadales bacterium]